MLAVNLDSYTTPSFVSSYGTYIGDLEQFDILYNARVSEDETKQDSFCEAYSQYIEGNHNVKHRVCYSEMPLFYDLPIEFKEKYRFSTPDVLSFLNVWDCTYNLTFDSAVINAIWYVRGGLFCKAYQGEFKNLQIQANAVANTPAHVLKSSWGQPGVMIFKKRNGVYTTTSTVFVESTWFKDRALYLLDYNKPCGRVADLSGIGNFMLEIVGDG